MQSLHYLLISSIELTQPQIVADSSAHQRVALRHINKVASMKRSERLTLHLIIYRELTLLRTKQSQDKAIKSCLAGTWLTQDSSTAAWCEIEIELMNDIAGIGS